MFLVLFLVPFCVGEISSSTYLSKPVCEITQKTLPNYYWRKYDGVIPADAVPGGHTPGGNITYIGQVLITNSKHNALLPVVIYAGKETVEAAFFGIHKDSKYVAILCSNTQDTLNWRKTKGDEMHLINDYLVVGGYEVEQLVYIGRASYSNHLMVGKALENSKHLRIAAPDGKELTFTSFEILVSEPPQLTL